MSARRYTDNEILDEALGAADRHGKHVLLLSQEDWPTGSVPLYEAIDRFGWTRLKRLADEKRTRDLMLQGARQAILARLAGARAAFVTMEQNYRAEIARLCEEARGYGITVAEIADALEVGPSTVKRHLGQKT